MRRPPPLSTGLVIALVIAAATGRAVVSVAADSPVALQGQAIQALISFGGQTVAGTDAGIFIRGTDGSWSAASGAAGSADVTSLAAAGVVLAAGTDNGVITSRDGRAWSSPTLTGHRVDALVGVGSSLIAGTGSGSGVDGAVYRSDDLGATWAPTATTPALEGLPGPAIQALGADTGGILAGSAGSGVFRSADARSRWAATGGGPGYVTAITALGGAAARTLAATDDGLFGTGSGGSAWTLEPFPQPDPWIQALAVDGNDLLAGTYDGALYRRSGAAAWSQPVQGLPSILSLLALGGGAVLIGTFDGIYCSGCPSSGPGAVSGPGTVSTTTATTNGGTAAGSPPPNSAARSAPPVAQRPGVAHGQSPGAVAAGTPGPASAPPPGSSSDATVSALPGAGHTSGRGWGIWAGAAVLAALAAALFVVGRSRLRRHRR